MLRVSRRSLYRMVKDGRIAAVRLGDGPSARLRIPLSSVVNFVQARAHSATDVQREA
jgi:excisionase family DNA binding protein